MTATGLLRSEAGAPATGIGGSTGGRALATFTLPGWGAMDCHRRAVRRCAAPPETLAHDGRADGGPG